MCKEEHARSRSPQAIIVHDRAVCCYCMPWLDLEGGLWHCPSTEHICLVPVAPACSVSSRAKSSPVARLYKAYLSGSSDLPLIAILITVVELFQKKTIVLGFVLSSPNAQSRENVSSHLCRSWWPVSTGRPTRGLWSLQPGSIPSNARVVMDGFVEV